MSPPPGVIPLWINGHQRSASDGATFEVRNPQNQRVVSVSASASSEDCQNAVRTAGEAFKAWEHTSVATKRAIFLKAADLIATDRYRQKIAAAVTEETGAVSAWGALNATASATQLRESAQLAGQLKGETWPSGYPGATVLMQRRAMGVILAIAPW
jgi:acyl-CoA reductase-like NAD-dependent aldehyde dehydrogenase